MAKESLLHLFAGVKGHYKGRTIVGPRIILYWWQAWWENCKGDNSADCESCKVNNYNSTEIYEISRNIMQLCICDCIMSIHVLYLYYNYNYNIITIIITMQMVWLICIIIKVMSQFVWWDTDVQWWFFSWVEGEPSPVSCNLVKVIFSPGSV